ncbi:MAG: hypothetical protein AAGC60_24900 [Acidobacteriota bacterium]
MADSRRSKGPAKATTSSGVESLIARLREEGVRAGQQEAEAVVAEAESRAQRIVAEAEARARDIVADAHDEAERLQSAGNEALRIAARDTVLSFREEIVARLERHLQRLVSAEMVDRELLRRLILAVAAEPLDAAGLDDAHEIELHLPAEPLGLDELKEDPDALHDELSNLARQVAGETWRAGVTFRVESGVERVPRVAVKDKQLEIELSAEAIAALLLRHLQPRFRALMQGILQ